MPTPITRKGHEALKAELDRLRKVERRSRISKPLLKRVPMAI